MESRSLFLIDLTINLTTRIISQLKITINVWMTEGIPHRFHKRTQQVCVYVSHCIPDSAQLSIFIYKLQRIVLLGDIMEIPGLIAS